MEDILIFATVISPIILALTEVIKRSINFKATYVPLVSIFIGLLVGFAAGTFSDLNLEHRLWAGVLSALAATGIFELATTSPGKTKE